MWKDNQILLLSKNLIYIKWEGRKMTKAFGAPGGGCAGDVMCRKEMAWVREDKEQRKWSLGSQGVFWLLHFAQGASLRLGTITAPIPEIEQIRWCSLEPITQPPIFVLQEMEVWLIGLVPSSVLCWVTLLSDDIKGWEPQRGGWAGLALNPVVRESIASYLMLVA